MQIPLGRIKDPGGSKAGSAANCRVQGSRAGNYGAGDCSAGDNPVRNAGNGRRSGRDIGSRGIRRKDIVDRRPKTGEFYRHFKDKLYQVVTVAEHTETGEAMVVYQALYGDYRTYVRPLTMFLEEVDHQKYPDIRQKYRFERVNPGAATEHIMEEKPEEKSVKEQELNPHLLAFIEAETYDQKLEHLAVMRGKIGQAEMDIIYVAAEMNQVSGDLDEQLRAVEQYLQMQKRYEGGRLR